MSASTITRGSTWQEALDAALEGAGPGQPPATADLALFFANADYADHFEAMARRVQSATGAAW